MLESLLGFALFMQTATHEVEQLLRDRALVHHANVNEVLRVARCENANLVAGLRNPSSGSIGIGQWLPGRNNHWDRTPAWREVGIDIHQAYSSGNPNALYYDVDQFAWSFGDQAQRMYPGNKYGWSCY